jgi:hypothetical protein
MAKEFEEMWGAIDLSVPIKCAHCQEIVERGIMNTAAHSYQCLNYTEEKVSENISMRYRNYSKFVPVYDRK